MKYAVKCGVETCKYLGVIVNKSDTSEQEINSRIEEAKRATKQLNSVLWSTEINRKTKISVSKVTVENIALYGTDIWKMAEPQKKRLKPMEMVYWRRTYLTVSTEGKE